MTSPSSDGAASNAEEIARKAHRTLEPLHIVAYFAPEPGERYAALGIKGGMRGYFASRSAAFGRVPAEVVIATFYNFNPTLIHKAIPSVWDVTTPEAVLEARYAGASNAYHRILGDDIVASAEMAEAAELAREATTALQVVGRPLYAAHASLPWPEPAHLQLFHAQTLLREHRGDGHIAALVIAELDAVEALVTYVPSGPALPPDVLRATRGWSDDEWNDGVERARARGLLDEAGGVTAAGAQLRAAIEAQTDAAAAAPYRHLGAEHTQRLRELARPWSRTISEAMFGTPA
jgi:hypothetical protein